MYAENRYILNKCKQNKANIFSQKKLSYYPEQNLTKGKDRICSPKCLFPPQRTIEELLTNIIGNQCNRVVYIIHKNR